MHVVVNVDVCVQCLGFHWLHHGWKIDPCVRLSPVPFPLRWRTCHCGDSQLCSRYGNSFSPPPAAIFP